MARHHICLMRSNHQHTMRTIIHSRIIAVFAFSILIQAFELCAQTFPFYVTFSPTASGQVLEGGVVIKGKEKSVQGFTLSHELNSPRDAATGAATGKRQHKALTMVLDMDKCLPGLMNAWSRNDNIPSVTIRCYEPSMAGSATEANYMTIKLTNASVSNLQMGVGPGKPNSQFATADMPTGTLSADLMKVSFVYQGIEVTYGAGNTFTDTFGN